MSECKTSLIPLSHNLHTLPPCSLNAFSDISDADITVVFQCLVGSFTYLVICTCLDLTYMAMALGQYNSSPTCYDPWVSVDMVGPGSISFCL
jgi:hypothetical protein